MKAVTRPKSPPDGTLEERFKKFATALMAVPKKELDKETDKHERKKERHNGRKSQTP